MPSLPAKIKMLSILAKKSAPFHMKTNVSLKYFVNDCRFVSKMVFSNNCHAVWLFMFTNDENAGYNLIEKVLEYVNYGEYITKSQLSKTINVT